MPSGGSSSLSTRRKTSGSPPPTVARDAMNYEPTASNPLLESYRSPSPEWKNGETSRGDSTTRDDNSENEGFQQQPTIINESDDLELLPHEHLDIDGGNENRKTIKDTMSSKEFLDTILHFSASFTAVAFPVGISMALSGIATARLTSNETAEDQSEQLSTYEVFPITDNDSRCMMCLKGYMVFGSTIMLGFNGGYFFWSLLDMKEIPCDSLTFIYVLWNFTAGGIVSIFSPTGLPIFFTQGYLILICIIMAWQLSRFDQWTCLALLLVLAFYDCYAVLSPYGPLKALVSLMEEEREPMPGLLYEANLTSHVDDHLPLYGPLKEKQVQSDHSNNERRIRGRYNTGYFDASHTRDEERSCLLQIKSTEEVKGVWNEGDEEKQDGPSFITTTITKPFNSSIKLGLGDFCFYSLLVAKASQFGFVAGAVCLYVTLLGLCITLFILSCVRSALPALPISIVFGVVSYGLTLWILQPFVTNMIFLHGAYL